MTAPNTPRGSYGLLTWCLAVGGLGPSLRRRAGLPGQGLGREKRGPTQPAATTSPPRPACLRRPRPQPLLQSRGGEGNHPARACLPNLKDSSRPDTPPATPSPTRGTGAGGARTHAKPVGGAAPTRALESLRCPTSRPRAHTGPGRLLPPPLQA